MANFRLKLSPDGWKRQVWADVLAPGPMSPQAVAARSVAQRETRIRRRQIHTCGRTRRAQVRFADAILAGAPSIVAAARGSKVSLDELLQWLGDADGFLARLSSRLRRSMTFDRAFAIESALLHFLCARPLWTLCANVKRPGDARDQDPDSEFVPVD